MMHIKVGSICIHNITNLLDRLKFFFDENILGEKYYVSVCVSPNSLDYVSYSTLWTYYYDMIFDLEFNQLIRF